MRITISHECTKCGGGEERVFRDTWTGISLCLQCLAPIAGRITNSPASEGDNLRKLIQDDDDITDGGDVRVPVRNYVDPNR